MSDLQDNLERFQWNQEPAATKFIQEAIADCLSQSSFLEKLDSDLAALTGTRLFDWVDHLGVDTNQSPEINSERLVGLGFAPQTLDGTYYWAHSQALLPRICLGNLQTIAIKVDSVAEFLSVHQISAEVKIIGEPGAAMRRVLVDKTDELEVWIVERHGFTGWATAPDPTELERLAYHEEQFRLRFRDDEAASIGFERAQERIEAAVTDLGVNRACDLFFRAEREYWQHRNRAAQIQKARQDRLGMGWANHDHHTYRSSRDSFQALIACLETLGLECRERFYAGEQAGWGAQVLEQPACGIVIFADVDLEKNEVMGDFAHEGLPARDELGTVGLWCKLHGEAFLKAGMHHLECQFSFVAAQEQLRSEGINTMQPFTDFEYLKQAFTEGEVWPVSEWRIQAVLEAGAISQEQAETFRTSGAIGSHLEILERNDGYKGFNQTGISEIILRTDPRNFANANE